VLNILAHDPTNHVRVFAEPDDPSALTADVDRLMFPEATPVDSQTPGDPATVIDHTNLSTTRAGTDAAAVTATLLQRPLAPLECPFDLVSRR
jgi:hypothetical protein